MRIRIAAALAACAAMQAPLRALEAVPPEIASAVRPGPGAFDTVLIVNGGTDSARVDSILVRFLDGDAPRDFIACKACSPDTMGHYVYGGWLYGRGPDQSLRYLKDSLFLLQDQRGTPVSFGIGAGDSVPFALYFPVNCPFCGRPPSYPGATRYAYAFIAAAGGRAELIATVGRPASRVIGVPGKAAIVPARARDAAGRIPSRAVGPLFRR